MDQKWDHSVSSLPASLHIRILNVHIPFDIRPNKQIWKSSASGELSLKAAYDFKRNPSSLKTWSVFAWSKFVPPSKSIMVWRLLLHKLSTNERLKRRNSSMPSMCGLCRREEETDLHPFFGCQYATSLWSWLRSTFNIHFDIKD